MNRIVTLLILTGFVLYGGCKLVGIMGTPTASETKVPAEYPIGKRAKGKLVVLVQQLDWLNVQTDLRPVLTEALNVMLCQKIKIDKKAVIGYEQLVEFRRARPDFSSLRPEQIAAGLGVETILLIVIDDYRLYEFPLDGYHKGLLDIRGYVLDAASGEVLWPQTGEGKRVSLALEAERGDKQACAVRLARAAAHCIVRYFYDCPSDKFRTWGERPDLDSVKKIVEGDLES